MNASAGLGAAAAVVSVGADYWGPTSATGNWSGLDWNNSSDWNGTDFSWTGIAKERSALAVLLLLFSVATVFGNALVIAAVVRERYLHTATNYFVTSLAVADCLVGFVVMPFSAVYEVVENQWLFGTDWCDVWRSLDVLFSTASILNLCVISLDRYWAITDPFTYPTKMTRRRAMILIAVVWAASGTISFPAILWWRAVRSEEVPPLKCPFTDSLTYLIFSSTISFYLPLFVMVFTYYRIYRAAVIQTRSLKLGSKQVMMASGELELTLRIHRGGTGSSGGSSNTEHQQQQQQHHQQRASHASATSTPEEPLANADMEDALHNGLSRHGGGGGGSTGHNKNLGKNFSISRKLAKFAKEKKAAKTLGIVMGVFIVCWLPFFVVNLLSGFCPRCIVNEQLVSAIVTWLGWINSGMNPVIYACWSRDFRR
ncbi:dopamine receptor 2 [Thrips palmi]|uniref:Dopamine receptor 2 n=1 Tax=Thrips palmi TaxID=161013 RepID=A0A6P8ZIW2_THRPL|nr:dopamine receptor 2 [Thrips palmi]